MDDRNRLNVFSGSKTPNDKSDLNERKNLKTVSRVENRFTAMSDSEKEADFLYR